MDDVREGEIKLVKADEDIKGVRAHLLNEGDVITVKDTTVQFGEDKLFYEVEYMGRDMYYQSMWKRTGRTFTGEQLNELCK